MIKIGIIGTGFGTTQTISFSALNGAEVIALCGAHYEKTKKKAQELNVPKVYKTYQELLADKEIDLVTIATPNHLHKPMFLDAVKAKKHIILEKPAGLNSTEIKEELRAVKEYNKLVIVDHPLRFNPVTIKLKELIENGTLGTISNIQVSAYVNYVSADDKSFIWIDYPEYGGGQMLNMGTHEIDLIRFIFDMPKLQHGNLIKKTVIEKYPNKQGEMKSPDIEHQIMANMELENGVNATFFNVTTSFGYKNFEIRILGSKGVAFYDDIEGLKVSTSNDQPLEKLEIPDNLEHIQAGRSFVSKSFKHFADALTKYMNEQESDLPYCTLEQALENMEILEQLADSN